MKLADLSCTLNIDDRDAPSTVLVNPTIRNPKQTEHSFTLYSNLMNETMVPSPSSQPFGRPGVAGMVDTTQRTENAVIIPMQASSVQRIVAGQAITDLASAIKELIDNALDAGSNTINIRLFNQGLDIVEVTDDGCGVPVESRPYMAMKHATSKIRNFDDIYQTDSLGFRGEALFCLANISNKMVVATQTANEPLGQKLEFTREGYLRGDTVCPVRRKIGTTVAVVKLFDALPVRRADLVKRIEAQRREAFLMVQGYAIHCLGIKFNLFDINSSGREQLRLSTMHGTVKLEQTISSVVGSAFLSGMSRIAIDLPVDNAAMWRVEGLVSKAPTLTGRDGSVARNAQFFCINGRPVDLPKVSKTLSEAWRTLEGATKKKPACILHFTLPKNSFDVNLSPNKRHVLLTEEKKICEMVYAGALAFWSNQRDGKFMQNEFDAGKVEAASFDRGNTPPPSESPDGNRRFKRRLAFVNDFHSVKLQHDTESDALQGNSSHSSSSRLTPPPPQAVTPSQSRQRDSSVTPSQSTERDSSVTPSQPTQRYSSPERKSSESEIEQGDAKEQPVNKANDAEKRRYAEVQERFRQRHHDQEEEIKALQPVTPAEDDVDEDEAPKEKLVSLQSFAHKPEHSDSPTESGSEKKRKTINLQDFGFRPVEKQARKVEERQQPSTRSSAEASQPATTTRSMRKRERTSPVPLVSQKRRGSDSSEGSKDTSDAVEEEQEAVEWDSFKSTEDIVMAARKSRLELRDRRKRLKQVASERSQDGSSEDVEMVQESTGDSKPVVSLTKEDFEEMQVIGQFNLGFILTKCKNNNLWVLDQHACDEKYNFERLCANTVMHEQKLLAPMPLELSPAEESCVLENLEIFEQNGFRFKHDPDKPPRHRLALTSLPHSGARDGRKAVQFGKDDVRALCAVLGAESGSFEGVEGGTGVDGSGMYGNNAVRRYAGLSQNGEKAMTRLPKAVAMFANRACRGSVMIGTALSKKEMETIVQRLANVQHPWNCPHGRPTLKHLCDMLGPESKDERNALELTIGPTVATPSLTQPDEEHRDV